jgi:fermentation-respiration switch protein FrsA (DUF1100 family)
MKILRAVLVAYVLSALLLLATEQLLLSWHDRETIVQGPGRDVWLRTEDSVRLYARYYAVDPALPTLLYLHGGAGTVASRSDRLALFASLGANLLAVEYRGYGASEGRASERGFELDASAAYAWLLQRTQAARIVPFGESMGGGLATWLASSRPVGGMILLSTSTSTPALFGHFMPWLPTRWLVRTQLDNLSRVKRVTAPKLFIHSRADGVVPFEMAEALLAAAPRPKHHLWLEQAGHNHTYNPPRARPHTTAAMRAFLARLR